MQEIRVSAPQGRAPEVAQVALAQYAIYPVWFGLTAVLGGFPVETIETHAVTFVANVAALLVSSAAVYGWLRKR